MELRHLRYFVAVAEEQNVTRAAQRLNISQPPLSRQIHDLESMLGVPLFERTTKALRLNDAGKVFLVEARSVLQRAEDAVQAVRAVAEGKQGELHVGYSPSLTVSFLPQALRSFQAMLPQVRVHLHDLSTEEMLGGLKDKKLHVALMVRPASATGASLELEELHCYPVCVAMSPQHTLARSRKITLERIAKEPLLIYSQKDYPEYLQWVQALLSTVKRKPQVAGEYDSASSLVTALESCTGLALVQQGFECFSGPRLFVRPIEPPPPPLRLCIASRKQARPAATVTHFMQAVRTAVSLLGKDA